MASLPPGSRLDGPPPSPDMAGPGVSAPPRTNAPTKATGGNAALIPKEQQASEVMKGIAMAFDKIDKVILEAARALPEGARDFAVARKALQAGLKKALAKAPEPPSASPVATGNQFPGGLLK